MEETIEYRKLELTDSNAFISELPHETIPLKGVWFSFDFNGILHKKTVVWDWPFDLDNYSEMFVDASLHGTHELIEGLPSPLSIIKDHNQGSFYERLRSTSFKTLMTSILKLTNFEFATINELWLEAISFRYEIIKNKQDILAWRIML